MERVVTAISCRRVAMRVADAEAAESWILAILAVSAIDAGIKKVEKVRKSPKKIEKRSKKVLLFLFPQYQRVVYN